MGQTFGSANLYGIWRHTLLPQPSEQGRKPEDIGRNAQIDLIIERADRMVNICEIKYSSNSYLIDNEEHLRFQNRMARFQQETAYSGGIIPVFITPFGLQRNAYSEYIINCIVLDDLF